MDHVAGVLIAIMSSCLGGSAAAITRFLTLALIRWGIGFAVVPPTMFALRARLPPRED